MDFKLGNAASVSVQSTSLTDQHQEQFVTRLAIIFLSFFFGLQYVLLVYEYLLCINSFNDALSILSLVLSSNMIQ